ncbi:UNVERIFIED_CONTAM: hypothetical protein PYX00_006470 [Menopon gallinae]|uniref:Sodium/potassium-transporting ATPase subunit beta-2 n=1 Tax=Menopon gallinae TaxID=328185 RepID=A0AAW2HWZ4_9NEOP
MWVFFQTLDPRIPSRKLEDSLIGTNPGLGFRPLPKDSTLIWYKANDPSKYKFWVDDLKDFLKPGVTPGRGQNIYTCDYDRPPKEGQVCDVQIRNLSPCSEENMFNFHKNSPCIFIKLNKIYGWVPEFYNNTRDLPPEMPQKLKDHISEIAKYRPQEVSCEGENPADVENIGSISYIPQQGFPYYYFPYKNYEGYLSPFVAVLIEKPMNGVLINIRCKAWAKNIKHSRQDVIGSVHLELMID